ncbi:hypothetical protein, conserved [Trypanosoma brucei gambiense DAL972]|uniref:Tyrosine decarboxylase n=1 Tax=Trypanosoma brucei gambiense (strain MHOM/CI/86/DAL972) TaxID=679716 RepID=C9ZW41_TRYB9|nr:hypothetical protein, conserved [Trypanosoma brucei gambiense DAL972]CBH13630.1 hypothetical protein, conserved [Trypanosoma brucei gambiense DAL972]|eukprot:XP_011775906.1 hypothetical protein, conserved [Trypanosoma brucei gambiense DAL972]
MLRHTVKLCGALQHLLDHSTRFINNLIFLAGDHASAETTPTDQHTASRGSSVQTQSAAEDWHQTQYVHAAEVIRNAAARDYLLDSESDTAELHASLVTALMRGTRWGSTISQDTDMQLINELERDVADRVARMFLLPSRFTWRSCHQAVPNGGRGNQCKCNVLVVPKCSSDLSNVRHHVSSGDADSGGGGGIMHSSSLESLIVLMKTAKAQARARYLSSRFSCPDDESRMSQRLVLYCSDQSDKLLLQAARCTGVQHVRTLQTVYSPKVHNYPMQVDMLKAALAEDVSHGFYPLLVCGVFGSHVAASVDPLQEMAELCQKLKLWFHIDASHSGLALAAGAASVTVPRDTTVASSMEKKAEVVMTKDTVWEEYMHSFNQAATLADSVHFGVSSSFLPTAASASSTALLYVSNVAKVDAALRHLNRSTESSVNAWCASSRAQQMSQMLQLRLEPQHVYANEIIRLSLILHQMDDTYVSKRVRDHQAAMYHLQQRIRADGRFDCSVHASCFGMVLFRWLLLADEETEALMWRWDELLKAQRVSSNFGEGIRPFLGLVRLQRRLHICVGFVGAVGGGKSCSAPSVSQRDVNTLVDSLTEAASFGRNEGRVV